MRLIAVVVACGLFAVLAGCRGGAPGFPDRSYDDEAQIKALEAKFEPPDLLKAYYDKYKEMSVEDRGTRRNEIVNARVAMIDLQYSKFVRGFSTRKETFDAAAEIGILGLGIATTAVGGEVTKTILGAASSGVSGTKLAIDKNFFFEKTVPVLISAMNAQRKAALVPIIDGLRKSEAEYPLMSALADVEAYYFAGTFIGALQGIQADAGAKEKSEQDKIDKLRRTPYSPTDSSEIISKWLWPDGETQPQNQPRVDALRQWLDGDGGLRNLPIQKLLDNKGLESYRQRAIKEIPIE